MNDIQPDPAQTPKPVLLPSSGRFETCRNERESWNIGESSFARKLPNRPSTIDIANAAPRSVIRRGATGSDDTRGVAKRWGVHESFEAR